MANNLPARQEMTIGRYLQSEGIKNRFTELLGSNAASFVSTVISICNGNRQLKECEPKTIVSAAAMAAALNLPVLPALGQAYIVPYNKEATFQVGAKGLLQLALRSGQYQTLHYGEVYEGQIKSVDCLTGEFERGEKQSDEIVGYGAYMRLVNGFEKALYMTTAQIEEHAEKYSKSYAYDKRSGKKTSPWSTNFNAMAKKTVLKKLLREYGILSISQQNTDLAVALKADQAVISDEDEYIYVDEVDTETGEVTEAVENEV